MKSHRLPSPWKLLLLGLIVVAAAERAAHAQYGTLLSGAGAVNRSMGGASTAAPLSAGGATFWNPATLPGLERSEIEIGAELLFADTNVNSTFAPNVFGPGIPPATLSGETSSDANGTPLPTLALAYLPENSRFSFGLGVFALAGFGVDYSASLTNPILTAPAPAGLGIGSVYSDFQVLQIAPSIAYQITDRFSIAVSPALNLASLRVDPGIFGPPDDANGDGFFTFPSATHSRTTWGGGATVGAYYRGEKWAFGTSFKTPQYFDAFRYNSADELGRPREVRFDVSLPAIASVGVAYHGWDRLLLALDFRYVHFSGTDGFGEDGFAPDGALNGIGWESIYAVAAGAQYQLTDAVSLRLAYTWNENPIPDAQSSVNIAAPTLLEHSVYVGASYNVTKDLALSATFIHAFESSITGPVQTPLGNVPGTSVTNSAKVNTFVLGANLKFGGSRRRSCTTCDDGYNGSYDELDRYLRQSESSTPGSE